jgi:cytochrome c oxidase subunit II
MRSRPTIAAPLLSLALAGCGSWQSALDPQGPQASDLAWLFWSFTILLGTVWLITMVMLASAIGRGKRRPADASTLDTDPATERRMTGIIATLAAITGLIVMGLTGLSYAGQKRFYTQRPDSLVIKLTGHQWWWEVRYEDAQPSRIFATANEIHIPIGERVSFQLASTDVIHSFWVPNLAGKVDLIPGVDNKLQLMAEREGVYRAQCAEFCGYQHAHMGLLVVAEPREAFEAWREGQIRAANPPADEESRKGQAVFLSKPCVSCHTIRGTTAGGRIGPDLTHLGGRQQLASATLPLTRGTLAAWIIDPQTIKPGAHMPMTQLQPEEIDPLLTYLMGLK